MLHEAAKHRGQLPQKQWDFRDIVGVGIAPLPLGFSLMNLGLTTLPMQQFPIVFVEYFPEDVELV